MANHFSVLPIRIAADGTVTYDFEGHVHAQGLDLDLGVVSNPPDDDRLRWLRVSDGAAASEIYAGESFGSILATWRVTGPDPGEASRIILSARSASLATETSLSLSQDEGGGAAAQNVVLTLSDDAGHNLSRLVYDGTGRSDWLLKANSLSDVLSPLNARANLAVLGIANNLSDVPNAPLARSNLGVLSIANNLSDVPSNVAARNNLGIRAGTVSVAGASAVYRVSGNVAHGLGVAPVAVFVSARNPGAGHSFLADLSTVDATNLTVIVSRDDLVANAATVVVDWLAIG